jgi:hypothetical protein
MSRHSQAMDPSQCRKGDNDSRRRSTPLSVMTSNYMNSAPPVPTILSPPPTPRSRPPPSDRLSLRLRSNSGLKLHINESVLSQYIDYSSDRISELPASRNGGPLSPRFGGPLSPRFGGPLSPRLSLTSPKSMTGMATGLASLKSKPWTATALASCLPYLDFLGKDAFEVAINNPSVIRHLIQYCEERGCEETVQFLMKVSTISLGDSPRSLCRNGDTYTYHRYASTIKLPNK